MLEFVIRIRYTRYDCFMGHVDLQLWGMSSSLRSLIAILLLYLPTVRQSWYIYLFLKVTAWSNRD